MIRMSAIVIAAIAIFSGDCLAKDYAPWDGKESIAAYARRNGLKERETIEIDGQTIEFCLVPAGTFTRGKDRPWYPAAFIFPFCFMIVFLGSERVCRRVPRPVRIGLFLILLGGAFVTGRETWSLLTWSTPVDETPSQRVTISRPFYLAQREITVGQVDAVFGPEKLKNLVRSMYSEPVSSFTFSSGSGYNSRRADQLEMQEVIRDKSEPAPMLGWKDATEFCSRVSEKTSRRLRLPTEAEWQWAAIGNGTSSAWHFGALDGGLHEWCRDAYMAGAYAVTSSIDPVVENESTQEGWIYQGSAPKLRREKGSGGWTRTGFRPVLEID